MKNRICEVYSLCEVATTEAEKLYIIDFTERTMSARKVEIHTKIPFIPETTTEMDGLTLNNATSLSVDHVIFDDCQFKDEKGLQIEHCECCLFPSSGNEGCWIMFVEIKDCKPKNIAVYKEKCKSQLVSTIQDFRKHNLISDTNKVHAVISFPRRNKTAFNEMIVGDLIEQTRLFKEHKIYFVATNKILCSLNKRVCSRNIRSIL